MITLTKEIQFDYGHRVLGHRGPDGISAGQCSSPHGHRARVVVEVEGIVQPDGMVVDFGIVKRLLMERVHAVLDHAFIVDEADTVLVAALDGHGWKVATIPYPPTAEHLAMWVGERIEEHLGEGLTLNAVTFWETPTSSATVRFDVFYGELDTGEYVLSADDPGPALMAEFDRGELS